MPDVPYYRAAHFCNSNLLIVIFEACIWFYIYICKKFTLFSYRTRIKKKDAEQLVIAQSYICVYI